MDNVTIDNYYPTSNYFISCILKVHVPTCFPCHIWDPNIAHLFANSTSTTCALFCQKSRSDKSAGSAGRRTAKLRESPNYKLYCILLKTNRFMQGNNIGLYILRRHRKSKGICSDMSKICASIGTDVECTVSALEIVVQGFLFAATVQL